MILWHRRLIIFLCPIYRMTGPTRKSLKAILTSNYDRMSKTRLQRYTKKRTGRHTVKNNRVEPNIRMKLRRARSAAINVRAILPEGSKRVRKPTAKAASAPAKKATPKLFKKSIDPFRIKGKYSMANALKTLGKGNYTNNSS